MAHELKMAIVESIFQLQALHWSARRIARELGIDRGTVRKVPHSGRIPVQNQPFRPPGRGLQNQPLPPGSGYSGSEPVVPILRPKLPESKPAISPAGSPGENGDLRRERFAGP